MHDARVEGKPADHPSARRPKWLRSFYMAVGWLCVVLGVVGLFMPFMPGAVFLIVAGACFARSSPRFEAWLLTHPRLGPSVTAWRNERAIPRNAKWLACLGLAGSLAIAWLSPAPLLVAIGTSVLLVAVALWIVSRPEPRGT